MICQQLIPWGISGLRPLNKVGGKTCQNRTASQAWHSRKQASEASDESGEGPGQKEIEGRGGGWREKKSERQKCQRELDEERRAKWHRLKTVGDGEEQDGQEWKNWVREKNKCPGRERNEPCDTAGKPVSRSICTHHQCNNIVCSLDEAILNHSWVGKPYALICPYSQLFDGIPGTEYQYWHSCRVSHVHFSCQSTKTQFLKCVYLWGHQLIFVML